MSRTHRLVQTLSGSILLIAWMDGGDFLPTRLPEDTWDRLDPLCTALERFPSKRNWRPDKMYSYRCLLDTQSCLESDPCPLEPCLTLATASSHMT